MKKHVFFTVMAIAFASSQVPCTAIANENELPADPWQNTNMPTVNTEEHSPYSTAPATAEKEEVPTSYEYFHDVPDAPSKYNDNGEISTEYVMYITEYLREIGYEIDPKVDVFVANAPVNLRGLMLSALHDLRSAPSGSIEGNFGLVLDDLEDLTGFNMENIISNTTRLMGAE
ncbi:MAG: hypothetical protein GY804_05095 [Alphaproteobacteria bacterium]|nr:hypothetical protein [Alphaproteobacteria bacterium]